MIEDCPETDIEFDAWRFTSAHELRHAECFTGIWPDGDITGCRPHVAARCASGQPGPASLQCRPANNRFEGYKDSNHRSPVRRAAVLSLPPSPAESVVVVAEVMVPAEIAAQIARLRSPTADGALPSLRWKVE